MYMIAPNAAGQGAAKPYPAPACSTLDDGPTCARCDCSVSVRDGEEWDQGIDVCDHCAQEQAHTSNTTGEAALPAKGDA